MVHRVTTVDKVWYNEWQRMTANDNEWYTTNDNEWYNEWQRITADGSEWQRMTTSDKNDNEWQGMTRSGKTNENKWEKIK